MRVNRYLFAFISFFLAIHWGYAELTVSLKPEEASRFIYEPFTLLLNAGADTKTPEIPSGTGYSVIGIRKEIDSDTFRIEIIPEEAGILTLPPFRVTTGEETTQTPPLRLPVAAPRPAKEMTLSAAFNSTNLTVDQPVSLTITWASDVPFTCYEELQLNLSLFHDARWEIYPLDPDVPEENRIGVPVNSQRIIARNSKPEAPFELSFSYQLIPRHEGIYPSDIRLSCARLDHEKTTPYPSYFDNHFFNHPSADDRFERIYLSQPLPTLTVQALPDAGRTVRYSGIVGSGSAVATIEPANTVVGQPMLLTVTLNDLTFSDHILNLPEATLEDIGSEFLITHEPMRTTSEGASKSFIYIVRPLRSGLDTLPALTLDLFDPDQKTYRTIRTEPLPITIAPDGKQTIYQPIRNHDPKIPRNGIRNNRKESTHKMNAYEAIEFVAQNGWVFWLLPPLLYLLIFRPWLRHRDRCRIDPAYTRARHALRRFHRTVRHDEEAAWKIYLANRLDLHAEAITFETIEKQLSYLDPKLKQAIRSQFERENTEHYAPPGTPPKKAVPVRKLVRQIEKATRSVLLALCLTAVFDSDASPAETRFDRAMEIRTEKPDEAKPLFTEAALEFEAEKAFFNAGNSWFFAGENGRALANYRAAEIRRPFNKQVSESIAFIRTQRSDVFQTSGSFLTKRSNVWKHFCRQSPVLRFGVVTLMYLIGWAAFLTARFLGKTIPRKAWIIYSAHALVIAFSLLWSFFQPSEGVVIQSTEARLGPGYAYEQAYDNILHEATEFQWLDARDGWVHARLPDGSKAWLRESACVKIR